MNEFFYLVKNEQNKHGLNGLYSNNIAQLWNEEFGFTISNYDNTINLDVHDTDGFDLLHEFTCKDIHECFSIIKDFCDNKKGGGECVKIK